MLQYLSRNYEPTLQRLSQGFPILGLTGPRQSGKTTLARHVFPQKPYISLEDPDVLVFANDDPKGFLSHYRDGAIFDECQRSPALFSYLQRIVDESQVMGQFVLTGSHQFGFSVGVSQSLAGRIGLINVLPFSINELKRHQRLQPLFDQLYTGFYPALYARSLKPHDMYRAYLQTYVERDVRQLLNVKNLAAFQALLKLLAGRCGSLLNLSSLGNDAGIAHVTVKEWISVLEASYVVFRLPPYFRNFAKRLIKTPKYYFYDTGLLCHLLGISSPDQLVMHPMRGAIFENMIICEYVKCFHERGDNPDLYFWRDNIGTEIDLLYEMGQRIVPVEIKSGQTIVTDFFKNLRLWSKYAGDAAARGQIIYGGDTEQKRSDAHVASWKMVEDYLPQ